MSLKENDNYFEHQQEVDEGAFEEVKEPVKWKTPRFISEWEDYMGKNEDKFDAHKEQFNS